MKPKLKNSVLFCFNRRALVILLGDGAEEKALELNGTDIGGWNALVKVEPEEVEDEEAELYESSNYIMTADCKLIALFFLKKNYICIVC